MKKLVYVLLVGVVALFGLTFAYKNHQVVTLNYYFGLNFVGSLPLLLLLAFASGLAVGAAAVWLRALTTRRRWSSRRAPALPLDAPAPA